MNTDIPKVFHPIDSKLAALRILMSRMNGGASNPELLLDMMHGSTGDTRAFLFSQAAEAYAEIESCEGGGS